MESIYAALLLHRAEKEITEDAIEKILKAAGAEFDKTQIIKLVAGLKERDIDEILKSASTAPVMAAVPATAAAPAQEAPAAKKEEKKKEEEEEEEEEEPTGIGSLF
ncbi:MAG: 50S ribosomal protein P1 [Promethearchaeota archaeon]